MAGSRQSLPTVAQLMSPEPVLVRHDQPLDEAARTLEDLDVSGAPVVDGSGLLVGVLSESDLLRARATEHLWSRWDSLTVREVMHSPALTADASMNIEEAATVMEQAHVHRLVVLGPDQRSPIGVVSVGDLVRSMIRERAQT